MKIKTLIEKLKKTLCDTTKDREQVKVFVVKNNLKGQPQ